jgi:hypothetical protein
MTSNAQMGMTSRVRLQADSRRRLLAAAAFACVACAAHVSCSRAPAAPATPTFRSPEDAVRALNQAVEKRDMAGVVKFFGPEGQDLVDASDPATARRHLEVFTAAVAEGWRLVDGERGKLLVIGNEAWPFPVPLVEDGRGWRFDTAAGREEILARRIGRNELAAIDVCRRYVAAQRLYARRGHDGRPSGVYAMSVRSDPGRQNGLYWPVSHGQPRSPLGDLIGDAAQEETRSSVSGQPPAPFHGYYFRILTAQGRAAAGGEKNYVVNGRMAAGFALVAWPARYDSTGIMTFVVNQDGIVHERDLGAESDAAARTMTLYDPDASWAPVQ